MSALTDGQIIRIAYAAMVDAGATLDESVDDLVADFEAGNEDEDQHHALASYRAVSDAAVAAYVADHLEDKLEMVEPFGYFRAEPFGWTECAPDDEGAVALYERPHQSEDKLEMVLPEGYALVPAVSTSRMDIAVVDFAESIGIDLSRENAEMLWLKMLATAKVAKEAK